MPRWTNPNYPPAESNIPRRPITWNGWQEEPAQRSCRSTAPPDYPIERRHEVFLALVCLVLGGLLLWKLIADMCRG